MSTVGANGTILTISGGVPTWANPATVSLTSGVSGILPVANGGTGSSGPANGTGAVVLTSNATLTTPNIGVATGTSLTTTGRGSLATLLVPNFASIADQGLHLQWNRSTSQGESWIINQRGGGAGGIRFGESTAGNVVTETIRINPDSSIRYNFGTANLALFLNGNKDLVTRPGFSYQVWNATGLTGMPNNTWVFLTNMTKSSGGGQGELVMWDTTNARFRNDNGTPMLYVASVTSGHSDVATFVYNQRIVANGNIINESSTSVSTGLIAGLSSTGVINAGQSLEFQVWQNSGFGRNADKIRISITTYPLL